MSKARDLSKLDITDAISVTVNNTATVAQMSTDANNALLVENTNAAGVSGLRMRGGSGKAAIMYGENNSTDEFSIIPRNDTSKAFTIDSVGNVVVAGNLQIEGSQTVLNTATLSVEDLNITVASGATTDSEANGAGLTVAGAAATLLYTATGDKWAFNKPLDVTGVITGDDGVSIQGGTGNAYLQVGSDTGSWTWKNYRSTHKLALEDSDGTGEVLNFNTSGHATFAGSVTSTQLKIEGTEPILFFNDTTTGHDDWKMYADWDQFQIQQYVNDTTWTSRLHFAANGNATFSGNVTTGASLISTNAIVDNLTVKTSTGSMLVKTSAGANIARFNNILTTDLFGSLDVTGNITVSGTVDGVDLQTLNTTAGAALPKAGGTMTGALAIADNITQSGGDYIYSGGINFDIKHTGGGQNIVFSTTPSGGSTAEVLRITSTGVLAKETGDLTLDVAGNIELDADGGAVKFLDGGTGFGEVFKASSNMIVYSSISNGDMKFMGNDGGSNITALTLDMSAAGAATFNAGITASNAGVIKASRSDNARSLLLYTDNTSATVESDTDPLLLISPETITLDAAYDIILDADGGDFKFRDGGAGFFTISNSSLDAVLKVEQSDEDFIIKGNDGGSEITALTLDMSAAGFASFNNGITLKNDLFINNADGSATAGYLYNDSNDFVIRSYTSNKDIIFKGNDSGSVITALTLDMSEAGEATFNSDIKLGDGKVARFGTDQDFRIGFDGSTATLQNVTSDSDITFIGKDGSLEITALTLDMSEAGNATFKSKVGIGAAPGYPLHLYVSESANTDLDTTFIYLQNPSDGGAAIEFVNGVAAKGKISFAVDGNGSQTDETDFTISTSTANGGALTDRLLIDTYGNFIIKTIGGATTAIFGGTNLVNGITAVPSNAGTPFVVGRDTGTLRAAHFAGHLKFDSGYGIDFSATGNGSGTTTSELLDDYEEGTWTPALVSYAGTNPTVSGSSSGWYTKIGQLVTVSFSLDSISVSGVTSGILKIEGLPFTSNGEAAGVYTANQITLQRLDTSSIMVLANGFGILSQNNGGNWAWELNSIFDGNSALRATVSYRTLS